jgi:hypothetical protein
MTATVTIPEGFNGPLGSGNGGYGCGLVARLIDGAAEVNLRSPLPLGRPLEVAVDERGEVTLSDGATQIADGSPIDAPDVELPAPVGLDEARGAKGHYAGMSEGPFSRCFVCGRGREDSFGVFAGPVEGRDIVSSPWRPFEWTGDADGIVRPEFVWSVLDCPSGYGSLLLGVSGIGVLARLAAEILAPVPVDAEYVAIGWPIERDGRKHHAGSAILTADGEPLAVARALMIELRG